MTHSVVSGSHLKYNELSTVKDRRIWARVAITELPYPVIVADDVALNLFGNRLLMRVLSTTFTLTVYFSDVKQLSLFDEHNTLEIQVALNDDVIRTYAVMCLDDGVALMLYEVLLTFLPSHVKNTAVRRSNEPSFHLRDYPRSLLSPRMMDATGFHELRSLRSLEKPLNKEAHERLGSLTSQHNISSEHQFSDSDRNCYSSVSHASLFPSTKFQPVGMMQQPVRTTSPATEESYFQRSKLRTSDAPLENFRVMPCPACGSGTTTKEPTSNSLPNVQQEDQTSNDTHDDQPRLLSYVVLSNKEESTSPPETYREPLPSGPITPTSHYPSHSLTSPRARDAPENLLYFYI